MNTKSASLIIGIIFIVFGVLGFVANPVIGESMDSIFHADPVHNCIHIISGILFLVFAFAAPASAGFFMKLFGIVYFLLGVIGMATIGNSEMIKLLGFLHVNAADNYLHIALGVVIFLSGWLPQVSSSPSSARA